MNMPITKENIKLLITDIYLQYLTAAVIQKIQCWIFLSDQWKCAENHKNTKIITIVWNDTHTAFDNIDMVSNDSLHHIKLVSPIK